MAKLEIRAGKFDQQADTGVLTPDTRKGLLRVCTEGDCIFISWHERTAGSALDAEDEYAVFVGESASFAKVEGVEGRVFKLEWGQQKAFFWMQEPQSSKDSEFQAAITEEFAKLADMEQGNQGPQSMNPEYEEPSAASSALTAADLARILGGLASGSPAKAGPLLSDLLQPEVFIPIVTEQANLDRLAPHLPAGYADAESVMKLVSSPQFRVQLENFSAALHNGRLEMSQFNIQHKGSSSFLLEFLEGIQRQVDDEQRRAP